MNRIYKILAKVNYDKKIGITLAHKNNITHLMPKIIYLSKEFISTFEFDTQKLAWEIKHKKLNLDTKEKSLFYLIMSA